MNSDETTIRETTQPTIAGRRVGVGNIWERELPDEHGNVALRMSAIVTVFDPSTEDVRTETVIVGSTFVAGATRYQVAAIHEGTSAPGSITIRPVREGAEK